MARISVTQTARTRRWRALPSLLSLILLFSFVLGQAGTLVAHADDATAPSETTETTVDSGSTDPTAPTEPTEPTGTTGPVGDTGPAGATGPVDATGPVGVTGQEVPDASSGDTTTPADGGSTDGNSSASGPAVQPKGALASSDTVTPSLINPSADLDQCRNGSFSSPVRCDHEGGNDGWVNGNAGATNAHWREGEFIAYRMRFDGLTLDSHDVKIEWDTLKSGVHAIDYLGTYDATENVSNNPCVGVAGCTLGSATTFTIPLDSYVQKGPDGTLGTSDDITQVPGVFTCFGCTVTALGPYQLPGGVDRPERIKITFTASVSNPVLAWSGHIASQLDWGVGNSASAISGSPYHMRLIDLDGQGGNQDRSLSSNAVAGPPEITTLVSAGSISPGESVTDTATVIGTDQPTGDVQPDGTIAFYVCGPLASAEGCPSGGTQVGGAVTLVNGEATSEAFAPSQAGTYCFRAEYTPAASEPFSANEHTNTTTECFIVQPASISIEKKADADTVTAGDVIGFTITVKSAGPGTAKGVVMTDTLPTNQGLSWSFNTVTGGWSCAIGSGDLTCGDANFNMGAGDEASVHLISQTTPATCGTVSNTASVSSSNDGSGEASDSVTVNCPDVTVLKTADQGTIDAGDTAAFTIVVSSAGPGTAYDVTLSDALPSGVWTEDSPYCSISADFLLCSFGDMAKGDSFTIHLSRDTDASDCGQIENTAIVAAANEDASALANNESTATITVNCPPIGIRIVKDGPALAHVGSSVNYFFKVTLTTDEPLSNVTVTDPKCDEGAPLYVSGDDGDDVLEPGEVWHYACTHLVTSGDPDPLPNTAKVTGTAADGRSTSDKDTHVVDLIHPAIQIVKTVNPVSGEPGDTVTYTFRVTNTGDTALYDVSVDDDVIGHIGDIDVLDPGETVKLTADYVLPANVVDVVNVGTVTGEDVLSETVTDNDDASVTIVAAAGNPPPTAFTGSDAGRMATIGAAFLVLGLLALVVGRRRRPA